MKLARFLRTAALAALLGLTACGESNLTKENRELRERLAQEELLRSQQSPPTAPTPTPASTVQRQAPAKVYTGKMVEIGNGVYCTDAIADESLKDWTKVASMPNKRAGRPQSIKDLKGLPEPVRVKALAGTGSMQPGSIKKGQLICSMVYGDTQVWNKIRSSWTTHDTLNIVYQAIEHDGYIFYVGMPPVKDGGCDNDFWYAVKVGGPAPGAPIAVTPPTPAPTPAPAPTVTTPAPTPPPATAAPAPAPTPTPPPAVTAPAPTTVTPPTPAPTPTPAPPPSVTTPPKT